MASNSFFIRRIHSLSGVLPVGLFLIEHLIVNTSALRGEEAFNSTAEFMMSLPFLPFLELGLIVIPLLFHALYGLYIVYAAKNNALQYSYYRNWMFYLQRISAIVVFIFLIVHVWQTRLQKLFFGADINFSMMTDILSNPFMMAFYVLGLIAAVYHFANGLWAFFITWGITIGPKAQKVSGYAAMALFVVLTAVGISALVAFVS